MLCSQRACSERARVTCVNKSFFYISVGHFYWMIFCGPQKLNSSFLLHETLALPISFCAPFDPQERDVKIKSISWSLSRVFPALTYINSHCILRVETVRHSVSTRSSGSSRQHVRDCAGPIFRPTSLPPHTNSLNFSPSFASV